MAFHGTTNRSSGVRSRSLPARTYARYSPVVIQPSYVEARTFAAQPAYATRVEQPRHTTAQPATHVSINSAGILTVAQTMALMTQEVGLDGNYEEQAHRDQITVLGVIMRREVVMRDEEDREEMASHVRCMTWCWWLVAQLGPAVFMLVFMGSGIIDVICKGPIRQFQLLTMSLSLIPVAIEYMLVMKLPGGTDYFNDKFVGSVLLNSAVAVFARWDLYKDIGFSKQAATCSLDGLFDPLLSVFVVGSFLLSWFGQAAVQFYVLWRYSNDPFGSVRLGLSWGSPGRHVESCVRDPA